MDERVILILTFSWCRANLRLIDLSRRPDESLQNVRESFSPKERFLELNRKRKFSVHNITYILEAFQYIPTLQEIYGFVEQVFLPLSLFFTLPPPSRRLPPHFAQKLCRYNENFHLELASFFFQLFISKNKANKWVENCEAHCCLLYNEYMLFSSASCLFCRISMLTASL